MTDRWAIFQSGCDHIPSENRLRNKQDAEKDIPADFFPRDIFFEEKYKEWNGKYKSSDSCDETMQPFNPKDGFILIERHVEINQFEFGRLLILSEFRLPSLLIQWRYRATNWIPLRD